uniref:fibrobacter succinogenes major paralogous domain-containing protein n=1 Tax=Parabacteroides bouchesdurhonensis TaxID=1936995 RepID=UPI001C9D5FAF
YFFVLPAAGYRNSSSGSSTSQASYGSYWSSTLESSGKSPRLNFDSGTPNATAGNLANALSVRCVQAFTAALLIFYF